MFETFFHTKTKKQSLELVFATHNLNKVIEVQDMLPPYIQLVGLDQLGNYEPIEEDGLDLESNAQIKAVKIYGLYAKSCFADDTGLEVDALNGLPGVYSARFAGEHKNDKDNVHLLLEKMKNKSNRKAQFRTVICMVLEGEMHFFQGILKGEITTEPKGTNGFGYDAVFRPLGFEHTLAEMDPQTKNAISHRFIAFKEMVSFFYSNRTI